MEDAKSRIWISLAVFAVWSAVTRVGGQMLVSGDTGTLEEVVANGVGWHFVIAIGVLFAAIAGFRWKDMAFAKPKALVGTLWFPGIVLCALASIMLVTGLPPARVALFMAINTTLVGISEEVMFRGVIYRALEDRMRIWPAIILTCILFGSVHLANVFITGDLQSAALQSVAAAMSGLIFMAILIRTGSIWPAIIYHALWDFILFSAGASDPEAAQSAEPALEVGGAMLLLPFAIALPNFLFALVLLRKVR